jgi:PKD repeat protein
MTRRILVLATLVAFAGCTLDRQGAPSLAGPSELGLSLQITAAPDILTQDGTSTAQIEVVARDGNSQPVRGLQLRIETVVGGIVADVGTLSARTVTTNNDGRASATFLSPPPPPPTATSDTVINFNVTPVANNYGNTVTRTVALRLARPVNNFPNGAPKPAFYFSPTAPKDHEDITFDASGSTDDGQIVSYFWSFGDGDTATGKVVKHDYASAGSYVVTVTVTDDRGTAMTSAPQTVEVTVNTLPTASFVTSPQSLKVNTDVLFNASLSTAARGQEIVGYEWDFGDGTFGGGRTVAHKYAKVGSYTVVLIVTDSAGQTAATTMVLTIIP